MSIDKIIEKFIQNQSYFRNGAGYLAKAFGCSREEIYKAKERAREILGNDKEAELSNIIGEVEEVAESLVNYVGSDKTEEGQVFKYTTKKALSPKEIEELVGVDNINTYVARVWDKMLPSGMWTYSVDVRYRVKDFYAKKQLQDKLKELMPDLTPVILPKVDKEGSQEALLIVLADDHAGAVNKTNLFGNKDYTYEDRLMMIAEEVLRLGITFDEVHIISLGDQMNGWNKQTTRGGHIVESLSNEEQFDQYVQGRVAFYNAIFQSGMSDSYFVHDVENSNHSGLGMSYMANKALEMYLDGKFPQVARESITDQIGGFQYGKHVILMGHGKDEKFQRRPMPAVLNPNTDLYLYDYSQNKGYSPYNDIITFYKGDLHQLGIQHGKFGRYINVQSVAGNSDYGDANFGNTKGGALLEILEKKANRVVTLPIWF